MHFSRPVSRFPVTLISSVRCSAASDCSCCLCGCCSIRPSRSYVFLGVIWLIALIGIAIKLLWIDAPRLIGTALYLALGWAIAFDFGVVLSMPAPAIALLAAGGLSYTVGGVIYIAKKPNLGKMIGFHELFHLFVIVGSVCHYLMVFLYVL